MKINPYYAAITIALLLWWFYVGSPMGLDLFLDASYYTVQSWNITALKNILIPG